MTSPDPARRLHAAIADAVQGANPGFIVTGYVLAVEATDGSDVSSFVYDAAEGQSVSQTLGLLELSRQHHLGRVGDAS